MNDGFVGALIGACAIVTLAFLLSSTSPDSNDREQGIIVVNQKQIQFVEQKDDTWRVVCDEVKFDQTVPNLDEGLQPAIELCLQN